MKEEENILMEMAGDIVMRQNNIAFSYINKFSLAIKYDGRQGEFVSIYIEYVYNTIYN